MHVLTEFNLASQEISLLFIGNQDTYLTLHQHLSCEGYYLFTIDIENIQASLAQHLPDLVLLDLDISTKNSIEICATIHDHVCDLPILIHGNANQTHIIESAFQAGAIEFFPKPLNPIIMGRRIKNILQAQHNAFALKEKNTYLHYILNSATDYAIISADIDFNITFINPAFENMFQRSFSQVRCHSLQHFFMVHLKHNHFLTIAHDVMQGEIHTWVQQYKGQHLQLRLSSVVDDQQVCVGYALSALDISQRIQDKKTLLLTHQVFDKAVEGICVLDHRWHIIDCNEAFLHMLKVTSSELINRHVRTLHPTTHQKGLHRDIVETVQKTGAWKGVMHLGQTSQKTHGYWLSLSVLKDEQGNISHYVGLFTDIQQYDASRRLTYQTQKMEAMRTLVGGVAHHFNNMLAGILGGIFLAKDEENKTARIQFLENSEELGFQAGDMIHQLARFSHKDESLKHELALQEAIHAYVKNLSEEQQQRLTLNMACFPLLVQSDLTQFEQVFKSIIDNAFEAVSTVSSPHIQVTLTRTHPSHTFYQTHTELQDDYYAELSIRDNGIGISPKILPHVFDPFFTTKDIGKGCGLSLAIAYNIVEEHGGVIEAHSQERQTTFTIYLPLLRGI